MKNQLGLVLWSLVWLGVLSLGLTGKAVFSASGLAFLSLLVLLLESGGRATAPLGHFSVAPAVYLSSSVLGFPIMCWLVAVGAVCRQSLSRATSWRSRIKELILQTLPPLACALRPEPWIQIGIFLLSSQAICLTWQAGLAPGERAAWIRLREGLTVFMVALAALGELNRGNLNPVEWPSLTLFALVLSGLQLGASSWLREQQQAPPRNALEQMDIAEVIHSSGARVQSMSAALQKKERERAILEDLSRALMEASLGDHPALHQLILQRVVQMVDCQGAAVWSANQQNWLSFCGPSPAASTEPVVEAALQAQAPVQATSAMIEAGRSFPQNGSAAALPLTENCILYVGRRQNQPFSQDDRYWLGLMAYQGGQTLRAAQRQEDRERTLLWEAQSRRQTEEALQRLSRLLESLRVIAAVFEPDELLSSLQERLQLDVPHQRGQLRAGPWRREWGLSLADELVEPALSQNPQPVLIEDLYSHPLGEILGAGSLLILPFPFEEGWGWLALQNEQTAQFQRFHLEIAAILVYQAAAALQRANLSRQLQKTQSQAVQASKLASVGQLAAGVAHEINTPLGAIVLALHAARSKLSEGPQAVGERLDRAERAAQKAHGIIEKLLYYSREAGEGRSLVNLKTVVEDTLEFLGGPLRQQEIDIHLQLSDTMVWANQNEIQQVVANLLLNARDAVLEPGARARFIQLSTFSAQGQAVLEVADQGCGMTSEVRERVFEPFFTTKAVGSGTGLGLSVSAEIVKAHEGLLQANSVASGGSVFRLSLPERKSSHV